MTQNRFKDNQSIPFEFPSSDFSIEILVFCRATCMYYGFTCCFVHMGPSIKDVRTFLGNFDPPPVRTCPLSADPPPVRADIWDVSRIIMSRVENVI